ncbi:MAG: N-acetyltransferase family protein [Vicinamibacterales bacterium]
MAIVIRPAERRDLAALGRMGASLMRTHYAFDRQRFLSPDDGAEAGYSSFLGDQLDDGEAVVLVAEVDGVVAGYVYAGVEPLSWKELRDEAGFVHDLLVSDEARGHGAGRQLLDAAIAWLKQRGMPRVVLWTAAPNAGAQRLFERRGFRPTMVEMTLELDS